MLDSNCIKPNQLSIKSAQMKKLSIQKQPNGQSEAQQDFDKVPDAEVNVMEQDEN